MRPSKKSEEKIIARYFLDKCPNAPSGKLHSDESPDFIIRMNKKYAVGLELTQIHTGKESPVKTLSVLIEKLETALVNKNSKLKIYEKRKLNEVWLVIHVESLEIPNQQNIQNILSKLAVISAFKRTFLFVLFDGKVYKIS